MVRILLLGPNRWPEDTSDSEAGLKIRRQIAAEHADLDAEWIVMEDDPTSGDSIDKFLALATDAKTTHIFLLWPRGARMVGTEDELVLWQSIATLTGDAPECYLFHQSGVLRVERRDGEQRVLMEDDQGKSPYLYDILARGVYEQEWTDRFDLLRQFQEVLRSDLGVSLREEHAA